MVIQVDDRSTTWIATEWNYDSVLLWRCQHIHTRTVEVERFSPNRRTGDIDEWTEYPTQCLDCGELIYG